MHPGVFILVFLILSASPLRAEDHGMGGGFSMPAMPSGFDMSSIPGLSQLPTPESAVTSGEGGDGDSGVVHVGRKPQQGSFVNTGKEAADGVVRIGRSKAQ